MGRRVLVTVLAAALVPAVAACGGGSGKPTVLPPLTSTPAAASSPAAVDSQAADVAAVKAVVRQYYAAVNDLHLRMDVSALEALMADSCSCREQLAAIRDAASKGQHYIDTARIVSLVAAMDAPDAADVFVVFDAGPGGLVSRDGQHITSAAPKQGIRRLFKLRRIRGRWFITEIQAP